MAALRVSRDYWLSMCNVRHDAMWDSILSRSLPRCAEMESARIRILVWGYSIRSVRLRRACDARAAFARSVSAGGKELRARNCDRRIRGELDLPAESSQGLFVIAVCNQPPKPALKKLARFVRR